ncbi:DUF2273 domain-containing protein [uncultured Olegusella sp.]|uniref:DUF2273 domain-containing protein n=1 Tax=uncultured Olegusella sp. TaxID=1979846 RepID=UPI00263965AA|nr:DUF2273 domain-containing protein [uncultured Olegusella sp.]
MQEKKPKMTIEQQMAAGKEEQTHTTEANSPQLMSHENASQQSADTGKLPHQAVVEWVHRSFPGHENAVYGGLIGLALAILFLIAGPWTTLEIAFFCIVGVAVGQLLDGDPRIIRTIRSFFEPRN